MKTKSQEDAKRAERPDSEVKAQREGAAEASHVGKAAKHVQIQPEGVAELQVPSEATPSFLVHSLDENPGNKDACVIPGTLCLPC